MSVVEAAQAVGCREAFAALAPLFSWPDANFAAHVDHAVIELSRVDAAAGRPLRAFRDEAVQIGASAREIAYTGTFDLAPFCSPYLGVHLFGEEDRNRARLMIGLRSSYAAAGGDPSTELPDHIALVLSVASQYPDDEWSDLVRLVLRPALEKMEKTFDGNSANPYRHLVSAAARLSRTAVEGGGNA